MKNNLILLGIEVNNISTLRSGPAAKYKVV